MKIGITGSHGFVASALIPALQREGHHVLRLVRHEGPPAADEIRWNPARDAIDRSSLEGIDAFIHLAGENIGRRRWNEEHKARVLDSRVRGTRLLASALAELERTPSILLSASAIGYYGDRGDEALTEDSGPGKGFVADVCTQWEASTEPAEKAGIRVLRMRSGIILGKSDGVLPKMLIPFRLGLGGKLGTGEQWFSWVSLGDEVRGILHLLRSELSGPVNISSPQPMTNADFTKILGHVLHRPTLLSVPAGALRLALGRQMADETLLISQRVLPKRLEGDGFSFSNPLLEPALREILGR